MKTGSRSLRHDMDGFRRILVLISLCSGKAKVCSDGASPRPGR